MYFYSIVKIIILKTNKLIFHKVKKNNKFEITICYLSQTVVEILSFNKKKGN